MLPALPCGATNGLGSLRLHLEAHPCSHSDKGAAPVLAPLTADVSALLTAGWCARLRAALNRLLPQLAPLAEGGHLLKGGRHRRQLYALSYSRVCLAVLMLRSVWQQAGGGVPADAFTHADAMEVHQLLGGELGDAAAAAEWRTRCAKVREKALLWNEVHE